MDKDLFAAKVQRDLAYICVIGYFAILVMRGFGVLDGDIDPKEVVMLALTFWFLRQRPDVPAPGSTTITPQSIQVTPAAAVETVITPKEKPSEVETK